MVSSSVMQSLCRSITKSARNLLMPVGEILRFFLLIVCPFLLQANNLKLLSEFWISLYRIMGCTNQGRSEVSLKANLSRLAMGGGESPNALILFQKIVAPVQLLSGKHEQRFSDLIYQVNQSETLFFDHLYFECDCYFFTYGNPAGFESSIPNQSEILAINLGGS